MSFENPVYFRIMLIAMVVAVVCFVTCGILLPRTCRRWHSRIIRIILVLFGGFSLALAGYSAWFNNRTPPAPYASSLAPNIEYQRLVGRLSDGAPYVAHLAWIDKARASFRLSLAATPVSGAPATGLNLTATVPTRLLRQSGGTLLINGDFFGPWEDKGPQNYRPHAGDACETRGLAISQGVVLNQGAELSSQYASLWVDRQHEIHIGDWNPESIDTANLEVVVSGIGVIVRQGNRQISRGTPSFSLNRHPRSVIGLSADRHKLFFLVIDGRQPGYSAGMTWDETADFAITRGADSALMLDGGGSSTLVYLENGRPRVLNSPIHNTIPGRERPIANALVVY